METLDLNSNLLKDFSPLVSLKLDYLSLTNCPAESLDMLSMMQVKNLVIYNMPITNIEFVRNLNELQSLHISNTNIESLEPLTSHLGKDSGFSLEYYENKLPIELVLIAEQEEEDKNQKILEFYKNKS